MTRGFNRSASVSILFLFCLLGPAMSAQAQESGSARNLTALYGRSVGAAIQPEKAKPDQLIRPGHFCEDDWGDWLNMLLAGHDPFAASISTASSELPGGTWSVVGVNRLLPNTGTLPIGTSSAGLGGRPLGSLGLSGAGGGAGGGGGGSPSSLTASTPPFSAVRSPVTASDFNGYLGADAPAVLSAQTVAAPIVFTPLGERVFAAPNPEPASVTLLASGLVGLLARRYRRSR